MMWADQALVKLLGYHFDTVLDIGCGNGDHALIFRKQGKKVTTISLKEPADVIGDFMCVEKGIGTYDCIWASHVLEHQRNVGKFLERCFALLNEDGVLAVTVPPAKHAIVGGHVTLWNAGLLLYNLVLAGFDCADASVKTYGYNISVIVKKKKAELPPLRMDAGDIAALRGFFPIEVSQGFDGQIAEVNW